MQSSRTYRNLIDCDRLQAFKVVVKETDLCVYANEKLEHTTKELVLKYRGYIEAYIQKNPGFADTLQPWRLKGPAPNIVTAMARAGKQAGIGPMAAVAGVIAEYIGYDLRAYTDEVIVENGGDIFIKTDTPVTVGIYAGRSALNLKIGLRLNSSIAPIAVCTSSGTIGHSLSMGRADAVCVVSHSCALADAAATAIGNLVLSKKDIKHAIDAGKMIKDIKGLIVIIDEDIGMWGELEIVALKPKKG